jgi:VWFA-related protein
MNMRSIAAGALLLLATLPLCAQEKLAETIEVHVVNIDVVVTDRAGNPISGLTKGDFEILENGKPQTITNFYEVRPDVTSITAAPVTVAVPPSATPAPAPATPAAVPEDIRARRFVFLVDNYTMQPGQRNSALKAMQKFVDTQMKPNDEASLILWQRKVEMITPLTSDKAELKRGIETISSRSRAGMTIAQEEDEVRKQCNTLLQEAIEHIAGETFPVAWSGCEGGVRSYAESAWGNGKALIGDLRTVVTNFAGIDGRKVFIVAGASLPEHPGREIMIWAVQQFQPYMGGLNLGRAFNEGVSRSQTFSIADTARFANANGVTFYMIDAADYRDLTSAENSRMPADATENFMTFTNTAMAYKALADITGGSTLTGTQNFDSAFQTLARDLTSFYSLGYKPAEGSAGDRKITVRVKKPGLTARARQTFTPKSSEQEMNDRVVANVLHHGASGEWPVRLTAQTPEKSGDLFKLPITIEMDPKITLLPQEEKMVGGFVLYIVVGTRDGAMSKVTRTARKIEMPPAAESQFRAKPMTYTLMLSVRPGENIVSIGVEDQISNETGFARADVTAR